MVIFFQKSSGFNGSYEAKSSSGGLFSLDDGESSNGFDLGKKKEKSKDGVWKKVSKKLGAEVRFSFGFHCIL